jgi:uncharacterized membrane protein
LFAARERLPLLRRRLFLPILCLGAGAALIGALSNDPRSLFLVPALVNLSLLATFGATLWKGPSLVETLARLQTEELSPAEIAYCRSVTRLWCGFFLLNAAAIAAFALWGTAAQWTAYTGLVSYLLVGLLFASEYVYRHYRFRRYLGAPTDALLRRLFPPREAPGDRGEDPQDWLVLEAAESRHGARVLCGRGTEVLDSAGFLEDVARLVGALRGEPRGRWVLCTESAWACAVGLFALWQHGSVAVMPPNLEPGTLAELLPSAAGCLADRPLEAPPAGPAPRRVPILADGPREGPAAHPSPVRAPFRTLDHAAPAVELCTSGSTGNRKTVSKTLTQLEAEIEALEHQFGASLGSARVLGTVSFQHIYGLLFRVLWPLCAGRTFADGTVVDPALLEHAFAGGERGVLVGSPAHLKRLPELPGPGPAAGPLRGGVLLRGGPRRSHRGALRTRAGLLPPWRCWAPRKPGASPGAGRVRVAARPGAPSRGWRSRPGTAC